MFGGNDNFELNNTDQPVSSVSSTNRASWGDFKVNYGTEEKTQLILAALALAAVLWWIKRKKG